MEQRARYTAVGAFVLILLAAGFIFVLWLHRVNLSGEGSAFDIQFKTSVRGLRNNDSVFYKGVPVGRVEDIRIDSENVEFIKVRISVMNPKLIRENTKASLETQGLTGLSYILLRNGDGTGPLLKPKKGQRVPVIEAIPSKLDRVMEKAPEVFENLTLVTKRLTEILNEENQELIRQTLKNVSKFSATLQSRGDATFDSAEEAFEAMTLAANNIKRNVETVSGDMSETLVKVKAASETFDKASKKIDTFFNHGNKLLKSMGRGGAGQLNKILSETRLLSQRLSQALARFDDSPTDYLARPAPKKNETPW